MGVAETPLCNAKLALADDDRNQQEELMGVIPYPCVRRGNTRGLVAHDTLWAERDACFLLPGGRAGRLRHTTFVVLQGLLVVWLLAGCASAPPRMLSVRGCLETKPL